MLYWDSTGSEARCRYLINDPSFFCIRKPRFNSAVSFFFFFFLVKRQHQVLRFSLSSYSDFPLYQPKDWVFYCDRVNLLLYRAVHILWSRTSGLSIFTAELQHQADIRPVIIDMTTEPTGEAPRPSKIPFWRTVWDQKIVTDEVINFPYDGTGTPEDPYAVSWIPQDPRNPMNWGHIKKWSITFLASFITLAVSLVSSAYSGGISQIVTDFNAAEEIAILGVSLFVLGFAFGPLVWAPLSETFGRRNIFVMTYGLLTAFNAGACGAQNIQTLVILRFFGGFFGSSPFGNSGGTIADMFASSERGIAVSMYSAAPFLGPCLGMVLFY